jgi:hypothetical protein
MTDSSDEDKDRVLTARREARSRGYMLIIEEAYNIAPVTHMAIAARAVEGQATMGKFLAYGTSAVEAAENGADVLEGIAERGDPWPEEPPPA